MKVFQYILPNDICESTPDILLHKTISESFSKAVLQYLTCTHQEEQSSHQLLYMCPASEFSFHSLYYNFCSHTDCATSALATTMWKYSFTYLAITWSWTVCWSELVAQLRIVLFVLCDCALDFCFLQINASLSTTPMLWCPHHDWSEDILLGVKFNCPLFFLFFLSFKL